LLRGATGRLWQIQVQRSRIVTLKPARAWCSSAPLDGASATEQTACDRPAGATEIGRSDWEPWVHSQGSLLFSGERPATAGATVDGTRTGAVVESSVELTPSPHGSFLRHYHGPVFPHAARYFRRAVSPKISRGDRAASFLRMANLTRGRDAKDLASKKGEFSPKRAAIWMFGPSRVKGSPIPGLRRQRWSGARLRGKQGRQCHLIPCGSSLAIH
jgi:hypothetical protein